ncbi:MAG: Rrf2 family transcriptional regulator [Planctomycetes bacterium]|nr:Rrf2 family transcriptional regulator [Planctomycetota bacterium]
MQFNLFTDYSFRVLIHAGLKRGRLSTISEVTEAYAISRHHVVKVVHELAQLGYLKTYRGRAGGFELRQSADEISVGALVRQLERQDLVDCFRPGAGHCCLEGICRLQNALANAQEAFHAVLDRYTLADLIRPPRALQRRLGIDVSV